MCFTWTPFYQKFPNYVIILFVLVPILYMRDNEQNNLIISGLMRLSSRMRYLVDSMTQIRACKFLYNTYSYQSFVGAVKITWLEIVS